MKNEKRFSMKRLAFFIVGLMTTATLCAAEGINYDGTTLALDNSFTRTECGTMAKKTMKEVSGLAASRTTAGYLWAHGDENTGENKKIIAIKPDGTLAMTVNISDDPGRDDWEDIATGVYENKNYLFIGAIGDNDLVFNDKYYIYYFEEPAITSGTKTVNVQYIRFGYPDNKAHNTETLMYDNIDKVFYIVDKVDGGACSLYSLPFRTDYGTGVQRLTKVTTLGTGSNFELACGGDISPDGKWMAVKNQKYILLWERQGTESLSETAKRRPVQVAAYKKEEQGESLSWTDSYTFYTTSDSKKDTPIYKYVRPGGSSGQENPDPVDPTDPTEPDPVDSTKKDLYEIILSNSYSAYINAGETVIRGWYLAGTEKPEVQRCKLSDGALWEQKDTILTVTALNGSSDSYSLDIQAVVPPVFTSELIVFDGSEGAWVKSAYGWDSAKKWRFSKTDTDYSRELAGKTHVELFLPACDTVVLNSMSNERDVQFYINGETFGSKTKLKTTGNVLAVHQSEPFMLTVASAQTSGDGGIASMRMARKAPTAIDQVSGDKVPCTKVLRDGQIYIIRDGKAYTIMGQTVK